MDCKWFLYQKQMEKRTETLDKNAKVYYYGTRYEREFERRKDMVQEEKLKALPLTNKNARQFSRFFVAGATPCELDRQGRILLPLPLREFAGLEKDVVLAGMLNRIEIWSKTKWMENNSCDNMDDIAEQMSDLGLCI